MPKKFLVALVWLCVFVYAIFPVDVLPDFIPFVGWLDDLFITLTSAFVTAATAVSYLTTPNSPKEKEDKVIEDNKVPAYEPLTLDEIRRM